MARHPARDRVDRVLHVDAALLEDLGELTDAVLRLGDGEAQSGGKKKSALLGDICESIIGAVYLDGGFAAAQALVERAFSEKMRNPTRPLRDPKTMLQEWAQARGLKPLARLVGYAHTGLDPKIMGVGPISATQAVLKKTGLSVKDLDVIEANEAFAAQACAVTQELGLDPAKVNPNGSGISLGHPIGATGALITVKALYEQKSPPTINVFNQDPECDLDVCANVARDLKIDIALKNNFGFGGTNGSLVFKRF